MGEAKLGLAPPLVTTPSPATSSRALTSHLLFHQPVPKGDGIVFLHGPSRLRGRRIGVPRIDISDCHSFHYAHPTLFPIPSTIDLALSPTKTRSASKFTTPGETGVALLGPEAPGCTHPRQIKAPLFCSTHESPLQAYKWSDLCPHPLAHRKGPYFFLRLFP